MKEKSVTFYKRLIIIAALSILVITAGLLTFWVGNALDLWHSSWEENPAEEHKAITVNLDKDLAVEPKLTTESGVLVNNETTVSEEDKGTDYGKGTAVTAPISQKVVYLTFDDGPSKNTSEILNILEEEQVKATFFFNTNEKKHSDSIIKEAFDAGHAVGVLTSTGKDYSVIYASVNNYVEDFETGYERIYQITGESPTIFRFPGGSINSYNKAIYKDLVEEMTARGYVYFDWNVCAQDYSRSATQTEIVKNATKLPHKPEKCIVLMHDIGNDNAGSALTETIQFYKDNGYFFQKLGKEVEPITF